MGAAERGGGAGDCESGPVSRRCGGLALLLQPGISRQGINIILNVENVEGETTY